jgi:hypothetical protein
LIYSQEDSHASHIVKPVIEKGKKMIATYGPRTLERFERLSQPGLWAKTFAALLIGMEEWCSMRYSLTWKLRGTKSNRFYFQLEVSALFRNDTEYFLLPTPTASDDKGGRRDSTKRVENGKIVPKSCLRDVANEILGLNTGQGLMPSLSATMMGFPKNWTELPFQDGKENH